MDVGAMYDGYSADVTRTVPSTGKFTPEQLIIYNTVLRAQDSAFRICKARASFAQIKKASDDVVAGELLKLGIISKYEEFRTYYPHGLSHPIGLDTHDVEINYIFKPGMVITLEPGIYIPVGSKCDKKWWGIGVRIEDDVLIKENSAEWLSLEAPKLPAEIEKMMKK